MLTTRRPRRNGTLPFASRLFEPSKVTDFPTTVAASGPASVAKLSNITEFGLETARAVQGPKGSTRSTNACAAPSPTIGGHVPAA
jgi:hypothetical protein